MINTRVRVPATVHYDPKKLETCWKRHKNFMHQQLKTSVEAEECKILYNWLRTNNIEYHTSYPTTDGISIQEVKEWILKNVG